MPSYNAFAEAAGSAAASAVHGDPTGEGSRSTAITSQYTRGLDRFIDNPQFRIYTVDRRLRVENRSGEVVANGRQWPEDMSTEDMEALKNGLASYLSAGEGDTVSIGDDGSLSVDVGVGHRQHRSSSGRTPRSGPGSAAGQQAAQAAADRAARAGSGGSGGASGGGGGGGITTPRVGPFPTATPPVGEGGGGGADAMAIDPNAPLGIPPITSRMQPGSEYFSGGSFPSAGNPYEGLDANSNLYDVIAAMAGSQVGNQQAALNTLGGVFDESMGGVSAQQRGRIGDLLANPFSMNEGTLARIMGRNVEGINERAQRAMEQSAQSRASAGIRPDSGIAQAQDQQIRTQAMGQAQSAETQARIQQSMQNQVDFRSALGAAGGAIQQDLGMRERLAQGAAQGVLGQTTITGNEYLTNALLAAQGAGSGQAQMPQGGASLRMG